MTDQLLCRKDFYDYFFRVRFDCFPHYQCSNQRIRQRCSVSTFESLASLFRLVSNKKSILRMQLH